MTEQSNLEWLREQKKRWLNELHELARGESTLEDYEPERDRYFGVLTDLFGPLVGIAEAAESNRSTFKYHDGTEGVVITADCLDTLLERLDALNVTISTLRE